MTPWRRFRRWRLARTAPIQIISFPKCGRTWLQMLLSKVFEIHFAISVRNPLKLREYHQRDARVPLVYGHHDNGPEFKRPEQLETDKRKYRGAKIVFLVRDPRDVLISSYFQKTKRNVNFRGTLDEYLTEPVGSLRTNIAFYNIWMANRDVPAGFLLVSYEQMRTDPATVLRQVLDFMGLNRISDQVIDQAVAYCAFENMQRRERDGDFRTKSLAARDISDRTSFKVRAGKVGGYKEHLTEEQQAYVDRLIDRQLTRVLARYRGDS